ncbi:MAG: GNAT family N-acetyltransferase [Cyanobacteria bacterium P01_A01_bin.83]
MEIQVIDERSPYLEQVIELGDANRKTLGGFTKGAFIEHAKKGFIIIALNSQSQLLGYLMYAIRQKDRCIRLIHLCIDQQYRGQKIARKLVEDLKQKTKEYQGISLHCRRDYGIDSMWRKLGFICVGEKAAKTKHKILTHWWLDYDQLNLFSSRDRLVTESSLCAMLDLAIFQELCLSTAESNPEVFSLLADWLKSELTLCLTDEVSFLINSIEDNFKRKKLYNFKFNFSQLDYENIESFSESVISFCQEYNLSFDRFTRPHLIKTIASQAQIFITQNKSLLGIRDRIYDRFGLSLKTPTEIITQIDELNDRPSYQPVKLAGTQLKVVSIEKGQVEKLVESFREGETTAEFFQKISQFITEGDRFECWAICDGTDFIGLYVYARLNSYELEIPLLRIKASSLTATLAAHLIYQATLTSAKENRQFTKITDAFLSSSVIEAIQQKNAFSKVNNTWLRANFSLVDTKDNLLDYIINFVTNLPTEYHRYGKIALSYKNELEIAYDNNLLDLERLFFPAKISDAEILTFIIPIKPYWAQQLFDANLSNQTLFGASKIELALNKEAVYYKSKNAPRLLKPGTTGRILWYVSSDRDSGFRDINSIRACSILEEVIIAKPLDLYRRFRNLGIYSEQDILKVAKGDRAKEIMALRFSHTELFSNPISFNKIRAILHKKVTIQSPTLIDKKEFVSIYILGKEKSS